MTRPRKQMTKPETEAIGPDAGASSGSEVTIYPLCSYMDAGEIKRRGGPGYEVPKRHADALIAQRVASTTKPDSAK